MYAIRNKRTGEFAAKKRFYVFMPCSGRLTPILYTREYDAERKRFQLMLNLIYSERYGFALATDELEAVEVELKEV